jgi:Flp pilus assembly pilin Flp
VAGSEVVVTKILTRIIATLRDREEGQALAEYALIIGFVAMACVLALTSIGQAILTPLENLLSGYGS